MDRHLGTMLREIAKLHMDGDLSRNQNPLSRPAKLVHTVCERRKANIDRRSPELWLHGEYRLANADRRRAA
jgi:hypothetical protein